MTLTALVGSGAPKKENTKRVNTRGNLKSQKVNQMKISKSFSLPWAPEIPAAWLGAAVFWKESCRQKGKMCTVTQGSLLRTSNSSGKEREGDTRAETSSASLLFLRGSCSVVLLLLFQAADFCLSSVRPYAAVTPSPRLLRTNKREGGLGERTKPGFDHI